MTYQLTAAEALDKSDRTRLREIYESGFPPEVRSPFESLVGSVHPDEDALALVDDGRPVGFAMLRAMGETGWTFLRYLAVGDRGTGVGGVLWDHLVGHLATSGFSRLVWDVEDPAEPGCAEADIAVRERRIRFYLRQGAIAPPVRGYGNPLPGGRWAPMLLMTAPLGPRPPQPYALRNLVLAVYHYRWNLEPDDEMVRHTLELSGLPR